MKTKRLLKSITIVFITILILLNSVIPTSIYAIEFKDAEPALQDAENRVKKEVFENPENGLSQEDIDQINDFMENIRSDNDLLSSNKPVASLHPEDYKDWLINEVLPEYKNYYKKFIEEKGNKFKNNEDKKTQYENYLNEQLKDLSEEEKEEVIDKNLGKTDSAVIELTPEEQERAKQILDNKEPDTAWWEYIINFVEAAGNNFIGGIINAICALGDSVVNVMQSIMLPGSPEAVARRRNTKRLKDILDERGDDAFLYAFATKIGDTYKGSEETQKDVPVSLIFYSPEAIFSNKIPALDINFIDSSTQIGNPYVTDDEGNIDLAKAEETKNLLKATQYSKNYTKGFEEDIDNQVQEMIDNSKKGNSAAALQGIIAKWYVALRNIALVGLLVVLIYIGIRILISSAAEERAKYKEMIKDWIFAIVIVILIHYIMVILLSIVRILVKVFSSGMSVQGDMLMNKVRTEIVHFTRTNEIGKQFRLYTNVFYTNMVHSNIYIPVFKKGTIYGFSNNNIPTSWFNISNRQNKRWSSTSF